jgi:hypothetical protein
LRSENCQEELYRAPQGDCLYAGNTIVPIEGFRTITVTVQTLNGPQIIKHLNTPLVSSFHTSVVLLDRLMGMNVHWDTERLHSNSQTPCSIERYHGQWVRGYNAPTYTALIACSTQPRTDSTVSLDIWHLRLGHSNPEVIEHLNESVTGARLKGAPSIVNCETCSVSKAKHIISHRPYTRATNPYERIHLDLVEMTIGYKVDRLF